MNLKSKNPCTLKELIMYPETPQLFKEIMPYGGIIDDDNFWIQLCKLMPWEKLKILYEKHFRPRRRNGAKDYRLMMGLLIGKTIQDMSDRKILRYFYENPYFQYFCGMDTFTTPKSKKVLHASTLSKWRSRLGKDYFEAFEIEVQKILIRHKLVDPKTVMLDASVFESNIVYPNDVKLMNCVREWSCKMILEIKNKINPKDRIRTYRRVAKKLYLNFAKKKKKSKKMIAKTKKQMAQFLFRNMIQLETLIQKYRQLGKSCFDIFEGLAVDGIAQKLETGWQIYHQQIEMIQKKINRIPNRIVSFHQPQVRPILRGKENKSVEFGPKVHLSWVSGFAFIDKLSFSAFNEKKYLEDSIEKHKIRFGVYPKTALIDDGYSSRENREFLKEKNVTHSLKTIGKPPNDPKLRYLNRKLRKKRSEIEGLIGTLKQHWTLSKIIYTIKDGEQIQTSLAFGCHNLVKAMARI